VGTRNDDDIADASTTTAAPAADTVIPTPPPTLGHFTLGRLLGSGGMGIVFAAEDTRLERPVALKLVRPGGAHALARLRLVREGKALARLSHPNVVTVYEISVVGDQVFIVMELVDGTTLRDWLRTAPRPWREIVRVFVAAGRGLQAAHALGLVHRDFKPSNVLIDRGGAVKVSDFGLVGASEEPSLLEGESSPAPPAADGLTRTGDVMGTPAYMAPEQQRGEALDARADQFAFCLSLHEALTGRLPPDRYALERPDATPPRPLPRALRAIVARGLMPDPAARYPSMTALLSALERAAVPRRWPWAVAALLVAAIVGAFASARREPCPAPSLADTWDAARRAALISHATALDPKTGGARAAAAAALIDRYAGELIAMQASSCRATRIVGTQSDSLFDLRARCLDRRRDELGSATSLVVGSHDRVELDRAVAAIAELTPVASCADANALVQAAPEKPRDRRRADEILRERTTLETLRRAGRLDGLLPRAEALVKKAETLDQPATLSAALALLARVQLDRGEKAAGHATLERLTEVAAAAHDDVAAAAAWSRLVGLIGDAEGKPKEALALLPAARAAVVRAGNDPRQRVELLINEAMVRDGDGGVAEALARLDEASAVLVAAGAEADGSPLVPRLADVEMERGNALIADGKWSESEGAYRRAIALYRRGYGPDHPAEAFGWHNLGEALRHSGHRDEALAAYREAARIREAREGETPLLAGTLVSIGATLNALGRWSEAMVPLERAVAVMRKRVPAGDPALVAPLLTLATAERHIGRVPDARHAFDEAIAIGEKTGATKTNFAISVYNRGELEADARDFTAALADYRRARSLFEATPTMRPAQLVYPLLGEGRALVELGRAAEAVAPLERAIAIDSKGESAGQQAQARVWLGRALVESPASRARGRALMKAGRDELVRLGDTEAVRDADAMLARAR